MAASHRKSLPCATGIDVAADVAWVVSVSLGEHPRVLYAEVVHPIDEALLIGLCEGSDCVAIDAPGALSRAVHMDDLDIPAKFRDARCGEIALRRDGVAVPWVTPSRIEDAKAWMRTGFQIWRALEAAGVRCVETYPHGIFWRLAGRQVAHKDRPVGASARRDLLGEYLELPAFASMWSHDGIDALAAAYTAKLVADGSAVSSRCTENDGRAHDGSKIWLPPARA